MSTNTVYAVDKKTGVVGFQWGGCLRGTVSSAISYMLAGAKDKAPAYKSEKDGLVYKKPPYQKVLPHEMSEQSEPGLPIDEATHKKIMSDKLGDCLIIYMNRRNIDVTSAQLALWVAAANRHIGGLPIPDKGEVPADYYKNKPCIASIYENQYLVYYRASLYRIPVQYPGIVKDFLAANKKHKNFWISLYAATVRSHMAGSHRLFHPTMTGMCASRHIIRAIRANNEKSLHPMQYWGTVLATKGSGDFGVLASQQLVEKSMRQKISFADATNFFTPLTKRLMRKTPAEAVAEMKKLGNGVHDGLQLGTYDFTWP